MRYIYPQHPKSGILIPPTRLEEYEGQGRWLAQLKFQGSNSVIWFRNGELEIWNRHGKPFSQFKNNRALTECFLKLKFEVDAEYVFNGELLHLKAKNKTTGKQAVENTVVLFDILYINRHLTSETLEQRLAILADLCGHPRQHDKDKQALVVSQEGESQLWMAETWDKDFPYHYWRFVDDDARGNDRYPLIEGLMLKLKGSKNVGLGTKPIDVTWMARCRKRKDKSYTL